MCQFEELFGLYYEEELYSQNCIPKSKHRLISFIFQLGKTIN